jgi:hypothetical protein
MENPSESTPTQHLTLGRIAQRLGEPLHRIAYIVESRHLKPSGRAGCLRIFSESDLQYIASELRRIDAERGGAQ